MEYLGDVHKVGLSKDYPTKKSNTWLFIGCSVDIENNTSSAPYYTVKEDNDDSKKFDNYNEALEYYNSITKPKEVTAS